MMTLNSNYLSTCLDILEAALQRLQKVDSDSIDYQIFRNAVIKGFELSLEVSGKLLRKVLKTYTASPKTVDQLTYKEVFRHATKHGLIDTEAVERWFNYRDNRNTTAHDYGQEFAEQTLGLLKHFIKDARALKQQIDYQVNQHGT